MTQGAARCLKCLHCGATVLVPPGQFMETCPLCAAAPSRLEPAATVCEPLSAVFPFQLSRARAEVVYRQWLGNRLFRPHGLNRVASGRLRPLYIPAWRCHGTAESIWSITGADAPQTDTSSTGRRVTVYSQVLISASRGLPDDWPSRIGGFATGDLRPALLAVPRDCLTEIVAVEPATALAAARRQIETAERRACARAVLGGPGPSFAIQTVLDDLAADLVGLPVWIASFSFHGRQYRCLINGQTGAATGEAPVSSVKIAILFGLVVLAIVAVLLITQFYGGG